jgi:O-antigen/teichoic acid export membrane protein
LIAEPLVKVLLGAKWSATIPLIQVLIIYGLFNVSAANCGPIFLALGRPHIMTAITAFSAAIAVPAVFFGVRWVGVFGAAWAVTAVAGIALVLNLTLAMRVLHAPIRDLVLAVWRIPLATAAMAGVTITVHAVWPERDASVWVLGELVVLVGVGAVIYWSALLSLWRLSGLPDGAERHILSVLTSKRNRRNGPDG